jgi:predicted transcriptional regulator
MSIHVEIPEPLAEQVARIAKAQGKSPETVVLEALANQFEPLGRLNTALAPIREAFQKSGLSEDEAVELFEAEKHAMRREQISGK